ncbi:hypothetical protein PGTUg99_015172 [Puccinia graminis f. sp. tritici]|uniref:Uncharacterized protein n=1 Tax=Puccinia graminis f. sp. tritici TaxID=56615 RepID=A0A5B0QKG3_PUCGR|nr:hypothetical protein PGTUg99_015172 [Puccinia graminis f. sp. tritici]
MPGLYRLVTPTDHELITSIYDHVNLTARSLGENRIGSLYIETAGGKPIIHHLQRGRKKRSCGG